MTAMDVITVTEWASGSSLGRARPTEAVGEVLRGLLHDVGAVWSYQLTAIEGRSLTVGKVVIAFPQRDVHLDGARPLQVQVVERERD